MDRPELDRILDLHEKSYGLLLWLNRSLKEGRQAEDRIKKVLRSELESS